MLVRDLFNTVKNIRYLFCNTLTPSRVTDAAFRAEYSEISTILKTKIGFIKSLYNMTFGQLDHDCELTIREDNGCDHWFFINGVTTTKQVAVINELALENIFGVEFSTLYNPTNGIIADLVECISERTFDNYSDITKELYDKIDELLLSGMKVRIIAHSQGGIIASSLLKMLASTGKRFYNLELYTFASATDEDIFVEGVYQEHFCNENDFVSRMGMMNNGPIGKLYTRENTNGHLLNRDYLEHFKSGKYCNGQSRLYKYVVKN